MVQPKILVTGATGKVGGAVAAQLLSRGADVRVVVHKIDNRSDRLHALGAEVVEANMFDAERMFDAMKGTQRAFFLPPYDNNMLHGAAIFAAAAADAGVESVVGLSQWLASPSHPSLMTRSSWLMEKLFAQIRGVDSTIVNTGLFAEEPYLIVMPNAAHLGIYPSILGDSLDAPPSIRDIARVCVEGLLHPERHAGKKYRPTGPKLIGANDIVEILARVLKRKVVLRPLPQFLFLKAAKTMGFPDILIAELPYYMEDQKRGAFKLNAPNGVVLDVTGTPAESFEETARRYANRFERGGWASVRELANTLALPFKATVNAGKFRREIRSPRLSQFEYSANSPFWLREHNHE